MIPFKLRSSNPGDTCWTYSVIWARVGCAFPEVPGSHQEGSTCLPQEHEAQKGKGRAESCLTAANGPLELGVENQMCAELGLG